MLNQPLVSVLIPLYNKADYLEETLQSVLNQTYPNIEIIIVDDGSTDGSLDIAKKYLSEHVRVFEQKKKGACAARNKAFELSKGDFIQYLDADDLLDKNKIDIQVKILSNNPDCLVIGHGYELYEPSNGQKELTKRGFPNKDYTDSKSFILDDLYEAAIIHYWLMPRMIVEKTGGWDERISIYDDRDFYLRLVPLVPKIIFTEKAICYYRITDTDNHLSKKRDIANFQGALTYFSNAETYLQKDKNALNKSDKKILSCLYKKLFIVGLHNREVKESLYNRCIKYDVVPDCSNSFFIKLLKKILGVKMSFKILALRFNKLK
jgi:glycosyltransferase involved in cell wall biosynthesis